MYKPERFSGSSHLYNFWIDMNEPSVFSSEQGTFPMQNYHTNTIDKFDDGYKEVLHRDIHNAYGLMSSATTYSAILERNEDFAIEQEQEYPNRPFLLTRSHFIGSQKFGAYWTGDN